MSAARRGAVAATVLLAGFVALLLSPVDIRAADPVPSSSSVPEASATPRPTPTCIPQPICNVPTPTPLPTPSSSHTSSTEETTTTASTLTYAVLPGNVTTIPPTATPKPSPTPSPSPSETTDTGITALGTDTQSATAESTQATTVVNAQPGGDSSSVLPLTVLAFLVIIGGGAIFLITRLR